MIRPTATAAALAMLTACGSGDYDGNIGKDPVTISAFGATTKVPTTTGAFPGISAANTTVVQDGSGNGYAFAYALVNAADYGDGTGQANLAVAGVLPQTDLGTTPTSGVATMTGAYRLIVVENADATTAPDTWTVTRPTGTLSADIDFGTGRLTGASTDGALTLAASGDAGFADGFAGDVSYNGVAGRFAGELGPDDAVATVTGQGGDSFYAGGFIIGR